MELPSNKVGFALIFVVLCVASTIFFTKISKIEKTVELKNVDLLIARNTSVTDSDLDSDNDGLFDWQEMLYGSDPFNPDTDGDGTLDGEEVLLGRDPTVAGPNDPLITTKDYFNTEFNASNYATGTVTDKLSVDLFSRYLTLKKADEFTEQKRAELVSTVAQEAIKNVVIEDYFSKKDMTVIESTKDTVRVYGDDFARVNIEYYTEIDSYKNVSDDIYLNRISSVYEDFALSLSNIAVPNVAADVHLQIINQIYQTSTVLKSISASQADPLIAMVSIGKYQKTMLSDRELYTSLSSYFKNNGIIFTNTSTIRFWNYFEN